jgi:hypothetical protein
MKKIIIPFLDKVSDFALLKTIIVLTALFILNLTCLNVFAQWSYDPAVNTPVCTNSGGQTMIQMISDGTGGAIFTWVDTRNAYQDIYAQHIDNQGNPLWNIDGVAICTAESDQFEPRIISDGVGGAIITWYDNRIANNWDIYAQRINANGYVEWVVNGVAICTVTGNQGMQQITSDNHSGAIIAWSDGRNGGPNADIYAQCVDSSGVTRWNSNGVAICSATYNQGSPQLVSDGLGGAIITWSDFRGEYTDIYAQRITSEGVINWPIYDGVPVCTSAYHQDTPKIVSDGAGGAIICWQDNRNNFVSGIDIYAQKINPDGIIQWVNNGVGVCNAQYLQGFTQMVSDGAGGAYLTWEDRRSYSDIYAQKINTAGAPEWTVDGIPICTTDPVQKEPQLCLNSSGNIVIVWTEAYQDIFAQSVTAAGATIWTIDGIPVCNEATTQSAPRLVSDGAESTIIAWQDLRNENYDIYASKLSNEGVLLLVPSASFSPFNVFPNPFKDFLNIQKPDDFSYCRILITDLSGRIVMDQDGSSDQLNVQGLERGIYLIHIESDKNKFASMIIKN